MWISLVLTMAMQAQAALPDFAAELDARFVLDLHEKKIDDVLTLYTPDAVFVQPDGTEVSGAAMRGLYEQVAKTLDSDLHLSPVHAKRHGDVVDEDGTSTETLGHRDTGKVEDVKGTYRFVTHRGTDGRWRYTRMEWH